MTQQKQNNTYLQINLIFRLTTNPSSEIVVKCIYINKYRNVATKTKFIKVSYNHETAKKKITAVL